MAGSWGMGEAERAVCSVGPDSRVAPNTSRFMTLLPFPLYTHTHTHTHTQVASLLFISLFLWLFAVKVSISLCVQTTRALKFNHCAISIMSQLWTHFNLLQASHRSCCRYGLSPSPCKTWDHLESYYVFPFLFPPFQLAVEKE